MSDDVTALRAQLAACVADGQRMARLLDEAEARGEALEALLVEWLEDWKRGGEGDALEAPTMALLYRPERPAPDGLADQVRHHEERKGGALRDAILNAHGMAVGTFVQSDTEMRRRIGALLDRAINADAIMRGFLGRGGPEASRDVLGGTGVLDDPPHVGTPA